MAVGHPDLHFIITAHREALLPSTGYLSRSMGIPRLRQLLEPYAEDVDLNGRDIVIDGPGLAYHVLYNDRRPASSVFNQPSYSVLGQAAINWLDGLTKSGANV